MAVFGAQYIKAARITSEPENDFPVYSNDAIQIGALVKADMSITLASGEIYGDNVLDEKVEEFVSGAIAIEVTDLADEKEAYIYGSTLSEEGELTDSTEDEIPNVGLGYIKNKIVKGKKQYQAYFYPKAKAVIGNDTANTKAASITLAAQALTMSIFEPNNHKWRQRQTFNTEAEAKTYIDNKLKGGA